MKERPILFSGPMVRALLDGRKTQTRRVVKKAPHEEHDWSAVIVHGEACFVQRANVGTPNETCHFMYGEEGDRPSIRGPYGVPGDRLWVKESWWIATPYSYGTTPGGCELDPPPLASRKYDPVHYAADGNPPNRHNRHYGPDGLQCGGFAAPDPYAVWVRRPSIHMPRWASRLTLEITDVRGERLHDISETDAEAEGVEHPSVKDVVPPGAWWSPRDGYARLWEHINGAGSWAANPWVWAVSFRVVEPA